MNISPIPSVNTTPATTPKEDNLRTQALLEPDYSTKAGGKSWSADIEPFGNGYEATVPNLPGATAVGPSIERVESSLSDLISFFA